jgi:hypothetical protein
MNRDCGALQRLSLASRGKTPERVEIAWEGPRRARGHVWRGPSPNDSIFSNGSRAYALAFKAGLSNSNIQEQ